jgi:hypothetical protein
MAVNTGKDTPEDDGVPGVLTPPKGGHIPFDGNGKSMKVTKPVHQRQLIEEIYERLGDRNAYQVVLTGDDGDQTLYVLGDVDMRTVRGVLESHTPDQHYGLSDQDRTVNALRERLRNGEDLPTEDLNVLLRTLLG